MIVLSTCFISDGLYNRWLTGWQVFWLAGRGESICNPFVLSKFPGVTHMSTPHKICALWLRKILIHFSFHGNPSRIAWKFHSDLWSSWSLDSSTWPGILRHGPVWFLICIEHVEVWLGGELIIYWYDWRDQMPLADADMMKLYQLSSLAKTWTPKEGHFFRTLP